MAGVRSRLKLFEPESEEENMASTKPGVAVKPGFGTEMSSALQKFMERQKAALEGTENPSTQGQEASAAAPTTPRKPSLTTGPKVGSNKGPGTDNSEDKDETKNTSNSGINVLRKNSNPSENRRVSVPKVFQVDSNDAPKPWAKPSANSLADEIKPKVQAKSLVKTSGGNLRPTTPPKPGGDAKPVGSNSKPPVVPSEKPSSAIKPQNKSEANGIGPAINRIKQLEMNKTLASNAESITTSTSSSASSHTTESTSNNEPGKIDFRSQLRSTKKSQGFGAKAVTPVAPPTVPAQKPSNEAENDALASAKKSAVAAISAALANKSPVSMAKAQPELKRQSSNMILERKNDSKKFKKVKLQMRPPSSKPPPKPALPKDLDLTLVRQQYRKAVHAMELEANEGEENEDDDIYTDATSVEILPRGSPNKRQSERVSLIPDMSAEEEGALDEDGPTYDDGCTPMSPAPIPVAGDEVYVDAETERKEGASPEEDAIYEPEENLMVPQESEEDKKKRLKEEAEAQKRKEKERREEDKRRKKEEKEKAKKEKEELKLRKQFNLTGDETYVGEGVIQQDVKGWGFGGLSVKKGQIVTIVRLDNNPPNKWLIKTESGMGYVDSSIIEVDPAIIRQAMMNTKEKQSISEDQPVYDAVAQDGAAAEVNDMQDDEDIYEACPE